MIKQDSKTPGALADAVHIGLTCGMITNHTEVSVKFRDERPEVDNSIQQRHSFIMPLGCESDSRNRDILFVGLLKSKQLEIRNI